MRQSRGVRRQGTVKTGPHGHARGCNGGVLDLVYILITLVSFAGLAALVGVIDRRLGQPSDTDTGAAPTETEPRAVSR